MSSDRSDRPSVPIRPDPDRDTDMDPHPESGVMALGDVTARRLLRFAKWVWICGGVATMFYLDTHPYPPWLKILLSIGVGLGILLILPSPVILRNLWKSRHDPADRYPHTR